MQNAQLNLPDYSLSADSIPQHVPAVLEKAERDQLKSEIAGLLAERDAVLVAHYYVDGDVQDLAEETGGYVSDSLEMARFGRDHPAQTLIVAGSVSWARRPRSCHPKSGFSCPP